MEHINLKNVLKFSMALGKEKNYNRLLFKILKESMEITGCDGGTLFLCANHCIRYKIMISISLGICKGEYGEMIHLPPVPLVGNNVCACAALERKTINITDVYSCKQYDFSEIKNYDSMTGYQTQTLLVVPMENHYGEVIGVLQLVNRLDATGKPCAFQKEFEQGVESFASIAAVSVTNLDYMEEIKQLLNSFASVVSDAIDERTPYNANHTKNMVFYAKNFIQYVNQNKRHALYFSESRKEQLLMSVWLHDVGKMVISTSIMNKETRLGNQLESIRERFNRIALYARIKFLEHKISQEELDILLQTLEDDFELIQRANAEEYLDDDIFSSIISLSKKVFWDENGKEFFWLEPAELECLSIRKGTLTPAEREVMESHVVLTEKLLSKIHFSREFNHVLEWASKHHEYLDGSGYPKHLKAEDLPMEVRLLTVLDIFDALTATDRPYKAPMQVENAFVILQGMVEEGKLDGDIVWAFRKSRAWVGVCETL